MNDTMTVDLADTAAAAAATLTVTAPLISPTDESSMTMTMRPTPTTAASANPTNDSSHAAATQPYHDSVTVRFHALQQLRRATQLRQQTTEEGQKRGKGYDAIRHILQPQRQHQHNDEQNEMKERHHDHGHAAALCPSLPNHAAMPIPIHAHHHAAAVASIDTTAMCIAYPVSLTGNASSIHHVADAVTPASHPPLPPTSAFIATAHPSTPVTAIATATDATCNTANMAGSAAVAHHHAAASASLPLNSSFSVLLRTPLQLRMEAMQAEQKQRWNTSNKKKQTEDGSMCDIDAQSHVNEYEELMSSIFRPIIHPTSIIDCHHADQCHRAAIRAAMRRMVERSQSVGAAAARTCNTLEMARNKAEKIVHDDVATTGGAAGSSMTHRPTLSRSVSHSELRQLLHPPARLYHPSIDSTHTMSPDQLHQLRAAAVDSTLPLPDGSEDERDDHKLHEWSMEKTGQHLSAAAAAASALAQSTTHGISPTTADGADTASALSDLARLKARARLAANMAALEETRKEAFRASHRRRNISEWLSLKEFYFVGLVCALYFTVATPFSAAFYSSLPHEWVNLNVAPWNPRLSLNHHIVPNPSTDDLDYSFYTNSQGQVLNWNSPTVWPWLLTDFILSLFFMLEVWLSVWWHGGGYLYSSSLVQGRQQEEQEQIEAEERRLQKEMEDETRWAAEEEQGGGTALIVRWKKFIRHSRLRAWWVKLKARIVTKRWRVYLVNGLLLDLIACCVPFELLAVLGGSSMIRYTFLLRLCRLWLATRITRYLLLLRDLFKNHISMPRAHTQRVILLIGKIAIIIHWFACGWFFLTAYDYGDGASNSWMKESCEIWRHCRSIAAGYLSSLYWAAGNFTMVGCVDVLPITTPEFLLNSVCLWLGFIFEKLVIATVTSAMHTLGATHHAHEKRVAQLNRFLFQNRIPPSLRHQVATYAEFMGNHFSGGSEAAVLEDLPKSLRKRVLQYIAIDLLEESPYFDAVPLRLLKDLCLYLRPLVVPPHCIITHEQRWGHELFFLGRGEVERMAPDGSVLIATLRAGETFGCLKVFSQGGEEDEETMENGADEQVKMTNKGSTSGPAKKKRGSKLGGKASKIHHRQSSSCDFSRSSARTVLSIVRSTAFCELFVLDNSDLVHALERWPLEQRRAVLQKGRTIQGRNFSTNNAILDTLQGEEKGGGHGVKGTRPSSPTTPRGLHRVSSASNINHSPNIPSKGSIIRSPSWNSKLSSSLKVTSPTSIGAVTNGTMRPGSGRFARSKLVNEMIQSAESEQARTKLALSASTLENAAASKRERLAHAQGTQWWRLIIAPASPFRMLWSVMSLVTTIYLAVSVTLIIVWSLDPFSHGDHHRGDAWWTTKPFFTVNFAVDCFFIVDILLHANSFAFMHNGLVIRRRKLIRRRYVVERSDLLQYVRGPLQSIWNMLRRGFWLCSGRRGGSLQGDRTRLNGSSSHSSSRRRHHGGLLNGLLLDLLISLPLEFIALIPNVSLALAGVARANRLGRLFYLNYYFSYIELYLASRAASGATSEDGELAKEYVDETMMLSDPLSAGVLGEAGLALLNDKHRVASNQTEKTSRWARIRSTVLSFVRLCRNMCESFFTIQINHKFLDIFRYFLLLLLALWLLSFLWILVGYLPNNQHASWLHRPDLHVSHIDHDEFARATFVVVLSRTSDSESVGDMEICLGVVMMLVGMFIVPSIVGLLEGVTENMDAVKDAFDEKRLIVRNYMSRRQAPSTLQSRVLAYYDFLWSQHSVDDDLIRASLPKTLLVSVASHRFREVIPKVEFVAGTDASFLRDLATVLQLHVLPPALRLYASGSVSLEMCMVVSGEMRVVEGSDGPPLVTLLAGSVYGAAAILLDPPPLRRESVIVIDFSQVVVLSRDSLLRVLDEHPSSHETIATRLEEQVKAAAAHMATATSQQGKGSEPSDDNALTSIAESETVLYEKERAKQRAWRKRNRVLITPPTTAALPMNIGGKPSQLSAARRQELIDATKASKKFDSADVKAMDDTKRAVAAAAAAAATDGATLRSSDVADALPRPTPPPMSPKLMSDEGWLLLPSSRWHCIWHVACLVFSLWNVFSIPLRVAFLSDPSQFAKYNMVPIYLFDYMSDTFFIVDLILRARYMAVNINGELIRFKRSIWLHYLRHGFLLDFLAVLPLDVIAWIIGMTEPEGIPFFRLLKLLRFARQGFYFSVLESYREMVHAASNPAVLRSIHLIFTVAQVLHLIACIWFGITFEGRGSSFRWKEGHTWVEADHLHHASVSWQYHRALYWALSVVSIMFQNDISANNLAESIVFVVTFIIGLTVYAAFVANFVTLLTHESSYTQPFYDHLQQLTQFMDTQRLPAELRKAIHTYYQRVLLRHQAIEESTVYSVLPVYFRAELTNQLAKHALNNVSGLASLSTDCFTALLAELQPQMFVPHQFIVRAGTVSDRLFLIVKGSVERWNQQGVVLQFLKGSESFGWRGFLRPHIRETSLLPVVFTDTFTCTHEALIRVLRRFPTELPTLYGADATWDTVLGQEHDANGSATPLMDQEENSSTSNYTAAHAEPEEPAISAAAKVKGSRAYSIARRHARLLNQAIKRRREEIAKQQQEKADAATSDKENENEDEEGQGTEATPRPPSQVDITAAGSDSEVSRRSLLDSFLLRAHAFFGQANLLPSTLGNPAVADAATHHKAQHHRGASTYMEQIKEIARVSTPVPQSKRHSVTSTHTNRLDEEHDSAHANHQPQSPTLLIPKPSRSSTHAALDGITFDFDETAPHDSSNDGSDNAHDRGSSDSDSSDESQHEGVHRPVPINATSISRAVNDTSSATKPHPGRSPPKRTGSLKSLRPIAEQPDQLSSADRLSRSGSGHHQRISSAKVIPSAIEMAKVGNKQSATKPKEKTHKRTRSSMDQALKRQSTMDKVSTLLPPRTTSPSITRPSPSVSPALEARRRTMMAKSAATNQLYTTSPTNVRGGINGSKWVRSSMRRNVWGSIMLLMLLYLSVFVPFHIAFYATTPSAEWSRAHHAQILWANWLVDSFFVIDMILRLCSFVRVGPGGELLEGWRRSKHYMQSWHFYLHLLQALPIDVILYVTGQPMTYVYWVRLQKLLRLHQLRSSVKHADGLLVDLDLQLDSISLRFLKCILFSLLTSHWMICVYFFIGYYEDASVRWFRYVQHAQPLDAIGFWYTRSLWWLMTHAHGTAGATGRYPPTTTAETLATMALQILSACTDVLFIVTFTLSINASDASNTRFEQKMGQVRKYLEYHHIPPGVQKRILDYYHYMWDEKRGVSETDLLKEVPFNLRSEILVYRSSFLLTQVPLFSGLSVNVLREIAVHLTSHTFPPSEYIVESGEEGKEMFLIEKGSCEVIDPRSREVRARLYAGSHFGELALLTGARRAMSVRTSRKRFVDVFILARVDFDKVMKQYPHIKQQMLEQITYENA